MNDQGKKSPIQSLAAGLLGFVGIVGLGSLVMMHHGGSAAKAPLSVYAPHDAVPAVPALPRDSAPAAAAAAARASAAVASSPAPQPPAEAARVDAAASSAAPAPASLRAAPAVKLAAAAHVDMSGSAASSAALPVSASAAPSSSKALAKKSFAAPKLEPTKNAAAIASVHYGVSSRSELMGRAAGPVYNFSGGSAANPGGQVAADNETAAGALRQVDAVEKQIDASNASDADKAKLRQQLDQARAAAPATP